MITLDVGEKIVGGSEVIPNSIPWQVALLLRDPPPTPTTIIHCGGTLISPRHVLTAAHCFHKLTGEMLELGDFYVMVGEHTLSDPFDGTPHEVCRQVKHPEFNLKTYSNDFAILHLRNDVPLGPRAIPACLPPSSFGKDFLSGKAMTVSGWGKLGSKESVSDVLISVDVDGIPNSKCTDLGSEGNLGEVDGSNLKFEDNMLCAGNLDVGGVDSCQGDSGGMRNTI